MADWFCSPGSRAWTAPAADTSARDFHASLPGYGVTPLVGAALARGRAPRRPGPREGRVVRLGLPAFKVLGASWACHRVLQRQPGATLVTATDGNHGRAVARMAAHFGVARHRVRARCHAARDRGTDRRRRSRGGPPGRRLRRGGAGRGKVCRRPRRTAHCCRTPRGTATPRSRPGSSRATAPCSRRSTSSSAGRPTSSRCPSESDRWPRPSYATTAGPVRRTRACCRWSPTPRPACWPACSPVDPTRCPPARR